MIDFNSKTLLRGEFGQKLNAHIDAGIVARESAKPCREYLGASYLGGPCLRAIQYEFTHTPKDEGKDFDGQAYRRFERGHVGEDMAAGWLRAAGLDLRTHGKDGRQFGFADGGERFKGHIDGVVCDGPADLGPFPYLWEHKSLGPKTWKEVQSKGVRKAKPVYYGQMQIYMSYLNMTDQPALFTCTNADTMELHHERVEFDGGEAQRLIDRAVQVITATDAGEVLPRCAASEDSFDCKFCAWKGRCWA